MNFLLLSLFFFGIACATRVLESSFLYGSNHVIQIEKVTWVMIIIMVNYEISSPGALYAFPKFADN